MDLSDLSWDYQRSLETVVQLSKGDIDKGNSERSVAVQVGNGRGLTKSPMKEVRYENRNG